MNLAPIVLFVYNRPWHTRQTLEALKLNELAEESVLYIFSDGPKQNADQNEISGIHEVRELIREEKWCGEVEIIERDQNLGLAQSVITGVSQIISEHGKVIVLEDDIKVDPLFLSYMNIGLETFQNNKQVFHINGFNNESNLQFLLRDFYFLNFMYCWGWATWEDRWEKLILDHSSIYNTLIRNSKLLSKFNYENVVNLHIQLKDNIEGRIKTWAILWYSTVFLNNGLCLTPKYTIVENIGFDGSGIHCGKTSFHSRTYPAILNLKISKLQKITFHESKFSRLHLKLFYSSRKNAILKKLLRKKMFILRRS